MTITVGGSMLYMVIKNDDLTADKGSVPPMNMRFGPKRRTLKWRGRRFNVPTVRVVSIGFVSSLSLELS